MPVVELCPSCWHALPAAGQSQCPHCRELTDRILHRSDVHRLATEGVESIRSLEREFTPVPIERTEPRILTLQQIAEQLSPFEAAASASMITTVTSP